MQVLWLAIFLYSIGLGLVLHFRPALMFNENGSWKEFGYHRDSRHTLFPVWLFAIAWAFVSYAIAAVIGTLVDSQMAVGAATALASAPIFSRSEPESEEETEAESEAEEEIAVPVSRVRSRSSRRKTSKPRAGYYVLDPEQKGDSGVRRYIYYGSERPPSE